MLPTGIYEGVDRGGTLSHLPPPFSWKHKMKNKSRQKSVFFIFIIYDHFLKFLFLKWSLSSFVPFPFLLTRKIKPLKLFIHILGGSVFSHFTNFSTPTSHPSVSHLRPSFLPPPFLPYPFLLSAPSYIITTRSLSSFLLRVRVMVFNATFNNNSVISWQFYYWRKPLTCRKSLNFFYHIMLYRVHIAWASFKLTTLVVIGTNNLIISIKLFQSLK